MVVHDHYNTTVNNDKGVSTSVRPTGYRCISKGETFFEQYHKELTESQIPITEVMNMTDLFLGTDQLRISRKLTDEPVKFRRNGWNEPLKMRGGNGGNN